MLSNCLLFYRKSQLVILIAVVAVFIAFGALYRASSQGDSSETYPKGFRGGACTIETKALTIGYSGYFLPDDYAAPTDTIRSPHIPIQCGKIPGTGVLDITIDLLYPETARDIPLALRMVRVEMIDDKREEHEVFAIPPRIHPAGVVTQTLKLNEIGQYILYIDGTELQVEVPIKVGFDWKDHFKKTFSTFLKKD